ncbi:MAG: PepSY domain-containing protein [Methylobacter sp.]|nr:PepSY domain-containing protein [Methylobacter sp.]
MGLLLGFFLAVFGATGSVLVLYDEIDNILNADLRIVQAPAQGEAAFHSLAEIQSAAVGIMAIILLFSVLTGLIRWLQKRRDKLHRHM